MERPFFLSSPFLLSVTGVSVAHEGVKEAGEYDSWVPCNEAFINSIKIETSNSVVASLEGVESMGIGKLYAIKVEIRGISIDNNSKPQCAYCKKLQKKDGGAYPLFTDEVGAYYYGTFITREEFDDNFNGFGTINGKLPSPLSSFSSESSELLAKSKWPTNFNSPSEFFVSKIIPGWAWPLQYMQAGRRWLPYISWQGGYGSSGNSSTPDYSPLTFDVYLGGTI